MSVSEVNRVRQELDSDELDSLYIRYIEGESTVKELISEYDLDLPASKFISLFPPFISDDACPHCGVFYEAPRLTKTSYHEGDKFLWRCPQCNHKRDVIIDESYGYEHRNCSCTECKKLNQQAIDDAEKAIEEQFAQLLIQVDSRDPVDFKLLMDDLTAVVGITALIRGWADDEMKGLTPLNYDPEKVLFPNDNTGELAYALFQKGYLKIDARSPREAFSYNSSSQTFTFNPLAVNFMPNVYKVDRNAEGCDEDRVLTISELLSSIESEVDKDFACRYSDQLHDYWQDLAIAEIKEFVALQGREYNLALQDSPKLEESIVALLREFSTGQINYLIHKVSKDVAAFYQSPRCKGRPHALNSFSMKLMNFADYCKAKNWDISHYSRNWNLPRSLVSIILFDRFLRLPEEQALRLRPREAVKDILQQSCSSMDLDSSDDEQCECQDALFCPSCITGRVRPEMNTSGITLFCTECGSIHRYIPENVIQ